MDVASLCVSYVDHDWSEEEFSEGCYFSHPRIGDIITWKGEFAIVVLSVCFDLLFFSDALTKPVGRIHYCGTETSELWIGYIEGALQSGIRCANEIADLYRNPNYIR